MRKIEFEGCKLTLHLQAQTPHLHFQGREAGATLRGSEFKPKFDKYLKSNGYKESLDYKVSIVNEEEKRNFEEEIKFFIRIKGIWTNPKLTIICFNKKLQKVIENHIVDFFFATNFGVMQGKGFGCYIPEGVERNKENVKAILMKSYNVKKCWNVTVDNEKDIDKRCKQQMDWIKIFYEIMKSGYNEGENSEDKSSNEKKSEKLYERSFLFEYMHKNEGKIGKGTCDNIIRNIDNEKAWMKQKGIAPNVKTKDFVKDKDVDVKNSNSRYVRAFLGLSPVQYWQKSKITITSKDGIQRIPSPIFFKVVENQIYFIAKEIDRSLYGKWFRFIGFGSDKLNTPYISDFSERKFDIEKFVDTYVNYYNKSDNIMKIMKKNGCRFKEIKEIKGEE